MYLSFFLFKGNIICKCSEIPMEKCYIEILGAISEIIL